MKIEIIGGGIIGLAAAWRLAQAGLQVRVREAGRLASEASWAGAGMLAPGGEFRSDSRWARIAIAAVAEYGEFVQEVQSATGIRQDFRVCGALELAYRPETREAVENAVVRQRALGIRVDELTVQEALERAPVRGEGLLGAWWYPDEAVVDPRPLCVGLSVACRALGVTLSEHDRVAQVEAPAVVAAGAWSSAIPGLEGAPAAFPIKGHLIGYDRAPGSIVPIVRHGHHYILQRANGFTIAGSDEEPGCFSKDVRRELAAELARGAALLLPELEGVEPKEVWTGLRPGSETGEPVVQRWGKRDIWLSYGHFRNGILLADASARMLRDLIVESE